MPVVHYIVRSNILHLPVVIFQACCVLQRCNITTLEFFPLRNHCMLLAAGIATTVAWGMLFAPHRFVLCTPPHVSSAVHHEPTLVSLMLFAVSLCPCQCTTPPPLACLMNPMHCMFHSLGGSPHSFVSLSSANPSN